MNNILEFDLREFADFIQDVQDQIGFKVSSRGWAYILEQKRFINKDEFDKVSNTINKCRRQGLLPIDFTAEESSRDFKGVEEPESDTIVQKFKRYLEMDLDVPNAYTPDWWSGEEYYIQMVVEKVDLVTLFQPVCKAYHVPIANSKGWSSMLQRAEYSRRFAEARDKGLRPVLLYCIPKGELIQTFNSIKPIEKVEIGERILGENGYVEVFEKMSRNYDGKLYEFNAVGILPFSVTNEHPIKVATIESYKHAKDGIYRKFIDEDFVDAEKVTKDKYLKLSIPKFTVGKQYIHLGYKQIDNYQVPNKIKQTKGVIEINSDVAMLLGYYLGDGCHSGGVNLSFNKLHVELIEKYKSIIENELGYGCTIRQEEGCTQVNFGGDILADWLTNTFGKCAITKTIPQFVFNLGDAELASFLKGYIDADGTKNENKIRISTASKSLALQIQLLILSRYRELASLFFQDREGCTKIKERVVYQNNKYEIHLGQQTIDKIFKTGYTKQKGRRKWFIEGDSVYTPITDIKTRNYSGEVYNFTTTDHTIAVNNVVTHNCGDHDPDGLKISDFLRKNLRDLKDVIWEDGTRGYDPKDLIIDRFGLNYDFIVSNNFTWIDNLITGGGKNLADPNHRFHNAEYVQSYLKKYGARKCEANAIVVLPTVARNLAKQAIEKYLGDDALDRFKLRRQEVWDEFNTFMEATGSRDRIRSIMDDAENW